jgi:peptidoglycan/LPS O-acetylase OafA/YrhL
MMSSPTHGGDYRPDIDGLRAVAVLLVILFHLNVAPFSGGFVGVDVFFVISGFLITRLIVDEYRRDGAFRLGHFYARRARRILPALFCTVVLAAVGAFLLLPPDRFELFGGSMFYAVLHLGNVFFWSGTSYFDDAALTKPLLHLWSLGVEEQFYLMWPLLLVALVRRSGRAAIAGLTVGAVASLGLSGWVLHGGETGATAAFYLTPFRIFEFGIGALTVWLTKVGPRRPVVLEGLLLTGLALIAYAAVRFTEQTPFPFVNALVPCVGAALAIHAGSAPVSGWCLRHRLVVGIGLISYSMYLLHWPLIVLYGAYTFREITPVEQLALLLATVAGAALMYRFVEQPFRHGAPARWNGRRTFVVSAGATLLLAAPAAAIWTQAGWDWRVPAERQARSNDQWRSLEFAHCRQRDPQLPAALVTCQNDRGASHDIIIWGDSHARHLVSGFSDVFPSSNVHVLFLAGCVAQSGFEGYVRRSGSPRDDEACVERNRAALNFLLGQRAATIVLSGAKRDQPDHLVAPTRYLEAQLRTVGHTVVVMGDVMRPGRALVACRNVPAWLLPDSVLDERCVPDGRMVERELRYSLRLSELMPDVVDVRAVQCPDGTCVFSTEDGRPLFRDDHHLTPAGSTWLIERLRNVLPIRPPDGIP